MHEVLYPSAKIASERGRIPKVLFLAQNVSLRPKCILAQKCTFCGKVHFRTQDALFRPHAADAYKTNTFLMEFTPFGPKSDFGPKSVFWREKVPFPILSTFWARNALLGQKVQKIAKVAKKLTTG